MPDKEKQPRRRGRVEDLGGGRFKVTVYVGTGPGGRRLYHRKTLRDSTAAKAAAYARGVAAQADRGEYFAPSQTTLGEWLDDCLDRKRRDGVRTTSLEIMRRHVDLHILPALGRDTPLHKVTADAQQRMYDRLQDAGFKPSSLHAIHVTLKGALKRALRKGMLQVNTAETVELPPPNRPRKARVFDREEAARFVEASWRDRRYVVFVFALASGMRPSEFFGVEYGDLSVETAEGRERGVVRITKGVVWSGGAWHFNPPKTEASNRSVYFPAAIYHELMAGREAHLEELRRLGQRHRLVFTDAAGKPLRRTATMRRLLAACRAAGIDTEGRSLYTLRRSHATLSLLANENLKSLSERMGHKSVQFTQDEYVDSLPEMQQKAADRLETELLGTHLALSAGERPM